MTILGKILVILNLVFTLIVGALMVLVYAARTNWQSAYNKMRDNYNAAVAARDINAEEIRKAQDAAKRFEGDVDTRLVAEKAQRDKVEAELARERTALRANEAKVADLDREVVRAKAAESQIQQEKLVLEEAAKKRDEQNKQLLAEYNKANQDATASRLLAESRRLMTEQLLARNKELEAQVSNQKGGAVVTGDRPPANPPPGNVEGLITKIDDKGEFMSISIGSDSGIQKGHTLDAYRMSGEKAQYLGTIRVLEVRAKEAVARPEKIYTQLKPGDSVGVITHGG